MSEQENSSRTYGGGAKSSMEREQELVDFMIALYCKGSGHARKDGRYCEQCAELRAYTVERNQRCPHRESKTFCQYCKTHCYRPEMRRRITEVMRYSGPRMILHRPLTAIRHLLAARGAHR
jgi:hypothetical protein